LCVCKFRVFFYYLFYAMDFNWHGMAYSKADGLMMMIVIMKSNEQQTVIEEEQNKYEQETVKI
jgi:hypothetical protein